MVEKIKKRRRHFNELGKDIFTYGIMSALAQTSGLLLLPLLTRIFSVDEYGAVDVIGVFVSFFSTFMKFALPSALARYFWASQEPKQRDIYITTLLAFVAFSGFCLVLFVGGFSKPLATLLLENVTYSKFIYLGCWISLLSAMIAIPEMTLRLERRIVAYNLINLLNTVLFLFIALFLVLVPQIGVVGIFYAQVIANAIALSLALVLIRKHIVLKISLIELKHSLKFSLPLFPGRVLLMFNAQIDRLLILGLLGVGGVAIFGAAFRISKIVRFLVLLFRQAWQPYAMTIIDAPDRNSVYRKMLKYYTGIFASIGIFLTAFSPEIFNIVLPEEYRNGYLIMPWLIGSAAAHHSGAMTQLGILVSEKTSSISFISVISMLLNLVLGFILIKKFGIEGAAIGAFVGQLAFTGLLLHYSTKNSDIDFDIKIITLVLFFYITGSAAILWISSVTINPLSISSRVGLAIIICIIIGKQTLDQPAIDFMKYLTRRLIPLGERS